MKTKLNSAFATRASVKKGGQRLGRGLVRFWKGEWGVEGPVGTG
jgi:hypothetical protein